MTHAVLTGPIRGSVTLEDGTQVDVRPAVVYVDTPEQAVEVANLVGQRYAEEGHPDLDHGTPFEFDAEGSKALLQKVRNPDSAGE